MKKLYSYEVLEKARQFLNCTELTDLKRLGFDLNQVQLYSMNPPYYYFEIRKSNGGVREIEAPEDGLKEIQRQFNFYLQCIYFTMQTTASHGYVIRVRDGQHQKNILENARQHLHARFMLNVDFENFFHQVKSVQIKRLLENPPFRFDKKVSHTLAKLFTRKDRLPMGAPTSPALSNLIAIPLDNALTEWARANNARFTRFVDDLCFSSTTAPFEASHVQQITAICDAHQLKLNPNKTRFYGENDLKKVTGLVLRETIDIAPDFYEELDKDLKRLEAMAEVSLIVNKHKQNQMLQEFKQEVQGQVNFIGMIEGFGSELFLEHRRRMKQALNPAEEVLSARWTNSSYF